MGDEKRIKLRARIERRKDGEMLRKKEGPEEWRKKKERKKRSREEVMRRD